MRVCHVEVLGAHYLWWVPVKLADTFYVMSLPEGVVIHLGWGRRGEEPTQPQALFLPDFVALSKILPVPANLENRLKLIWHTCSWQHTCEALHSVCGSSMENILRQRNLGSFLVKSWFGGGVAHNGCSKLWMNTSCSSFNCFRMCSSKTHLCSSLQAAYCNLIAIEQCSPLRKDTGIKAC